jgi:hypothetical protein
MSGPSIGDFVVTPKGSRGRIFALRKGPDGVFAKVGSVAAEWEQISLPAPAPEVPPVVAPPQPSKSKQSPKVAGLPSAPIAPT